MRNIVRGMLALVACALLVFPALATEKAAPTPQKIQATPKQNDSKTRTTSAKNQQPTQDKQSAQKQQSAQGAPEAPRLYPAETAKAASFTLTAPHTVEEGGMLLIHLQAANTQPGPESSAITLHWRGKKHRITLHQGQALALLPAPLEPESRAMPLLAVNGKDRLSLTITIAPVKWPVQKLSVEPKYVDPPKSVMNRIAADRERTKAALATVQAERYWTPPFVRPVPGEISSAYGGKRVFNGKPRSRHRGTDLRGAQGTPIIAAAAGRVILAEEQYFSGNVVYVDHGQGLVTMYCHMSAMHVAPGDPVQAGQTLGLVGATGRVTGPHLHLSTLLYGESVNPMALFVY